MRTKRTMLAVVKDVVGSKAPNGEFEVILSMPTLDRDGEIIDAKAFEPLPDSIPFHAFHDFSDPIGRAVPRYDGDVLKATGYYASTPRAQEVRTLVAEGVIGHTSVGFMPPTREVKDGTPHIVTGELLEGSFVSVPSNREAAVLASKHYEAKLGARNSGEDSGRLQQIHDLSVQNGAACEAKALAGAQRKSVAGSWEDRRDQIRTAISAAYPDAWWSTVLATFDDSVVFEVDTPDGLVRYQASYSITDGAVTLAAAEEVDVTEVVTPKSPDTDPEKAAAPAAASLADVTVGKARLAALRAEAELLLID